MALRRILRLSAFFYWLVGVKAQALYAVVAALLGWAVRSGRADKMPVYLLQGIAILGVSVLVEWALFDGYSLVAYHLLRSVYCAPAFIQTRFLQFLMDDKPFAWSWLLGGASPDLFVTYFIGEYYFGNVNSNVNTDAFLYALSASGLLGYLTAVLAVSLILALYDRLFNTSGNPVYLFLGFLFAVLLLEQAYSVALISSGVGLLTVLTAMQRGPTSSASAAKPLH